MYAWLVISKQIKCEIQNNNLSKYLINKEITNNNKNKNNQTNQFILNHTLIVKKVTKINNR